MVSRYLTTLLTLASFWARVASLRPHEAMALLAMASFFSTAPQAIEYFASVGFCFRAISPSLRLFLLARAILVVFQAFSSMASS